MSTNTVTTALPDYPLVYAEEPIVRLAIVYNPFDLTTTGRHELVFGQSKTLADYMVGLPTEVEWNVAVDGELVPAEDWATTNPKAFSNITIVRVPEGGGSGSGKTILRVVALIAVMAFAPMAGPLLAGAMGVAGAATAATATAAATAATAGFTLAANVASAAVAVAGSMAVNAVLGPKAPSQEKTSTAYGIDGAKNSAREGVVVPVTYGDFRIGGNVVDLFTRNVGEDQYLYIRTVVNDGEVEAIEEIELNGQPLSSFTDVQSRVRLGLETEEPNDWFGETVRQFNRGSVITTGWTQHVTDEPVDRLRADVLFPEGLYFAKDDGRKEAASVTLVIEYATVGVGNTPNNDWQPLPLAGNTPFNPISGGGFSGGGRTGGGATSAQFIVQTEPKIDAPTQYEIVPEYREVGTSEWKPATVVTGSAYKETVQSVPGEVTGSDDVFPPVTVDVDFGDTGGTGGTYDVRVTGGLITGASTQASLALTGSSSRTLRLTYESLPLTRQRYAIRIKRMVADDDTDKRKDECWVTDFGEIDVEPTNVNGIANVSLRVKMTDQLSGIPTLTCKLKGSKVKIYDEDGTVVAFEKSSNPADIVADILLNPTRGAGFAHSKMVWPRYVEFREHCIADERTFNGTFDAIESMWDVAQAVASRGHGALIPRGTKFSFTINRAEDHTMVFTPANMHKDTFKTTWLGTAERANEIQMVFFDEENGNKQRTIRVTDNAAFARGEKQRIATTSGMGIVTAAEAVRETEFAARSNRYIKKTVEFDAPLEAIGLGIGDVALVQHDAMDFKGGVGGRLSAGSTTSVIQLDRPAAMEADKDYVLMIVEAATKRFDATITAISGSRVTVTGLPADSLPRIRRLTQDGTDVEILGAAYISGSWRFTVAESTDLSAGSCELWDTDTIEERDVVLSVGEHEALTLTAPLTKVPSEYANFLFGQKLSVKQPFRLQAISGSDIDRRTLSFIQYDQRIFERGGFDTIETVAPVREQIGHVQSLIADYDHQATPDQFRITTNVSWARPESFRYAGADIYTLLGEDGVWTFAGSAQGTSTFQTQFSRGESVKIKVVAFDARGNRARFADAPQTSVFIAVFEQVLEAPQNVSYSVPYFRVDATAQITWDAPSDALSTSYRVETKVLTETDYDLFQAATEIAGYPASVTSEDGWISQTSPTAEASFAQLNVGYRIVRVRGERNLARSPWSYLGVEIAAPGVPTAITGLRLDEHAPLAVDTFAGQDAKFVWNDVMDAASAGSLDPQSVAHFFRDYRVRILTAAGVLIREETTVNPNYAYTIEKNVEDRAGVVGPRGLREFKIEVAMRGRQGQISNPVTMRVSNPAPALATLVAVNTGIEGFSLDLSSPADNDVVGNLLYVSTTSGFTPGPANLVFQDAGAPTFVGLPATEYFFRYASYDAFGTDALNVSPQYSTTTNGISSEHFDPALLADIDADVAAAQAAATAAHNEAINAAAEAVDAANAASAAATAQAAAIIAQGGAATSASTAATHATNAGSSATSASNSANTAATQAGNASTSASSAANSATNAAGSASTATTQATNAANSATNAGNSATAANTSASNASTSATNAGNSATAANTSAVNAASSFNAANVLAAMQLPDRYDGSAGQFFTGANAGNPTLVTDKPSNATEASFGPVRDLTGQSGSDDWGTRGVVPCIPGRIYKIEAEFQRTASTGTPNASTNFSVFARCLAGSYGDATVAAVGTTIALTGAVQTVSIMVSNVASAGVLAWPADAAWLRPFTRQHFGSLTAQTTRVRRLTITDVTEQQAALNSANAAATSASNASTSATNAGSSASSAATSATNASTSAGTAGTHATNASNSATTATTQANNAATSASTAATHATNAGNSASAAGTSATTAGTHATNAGNSASAANTSAVNAASSFTNANLSAARLFPDRYDGTAGRYFTGWPHTVSPESAAHLPSNATASGFGPVFEVNQTGANQDFGTRGVLPATPGRIYEITIEFQRTAVVGTPDASSVAYANVRTLDSAYADTGIVVASGPAILLDGTVQTATLLVSNNASGDIKSWGGAVWLRPYARTSKGGATSQTIQFRRITVRDVTEQQAALTSAGAASTSASNASTSATNAGTSATSASNSANTASTQAGNASTSASNAASSATNAGSSASAANTSATNASTSASSAGTSASNASTSATNAGSSATTAASSATTAGTHATTAGTHASTAATHASNASNSAASASTSAGIAAAVGLGSMNQNPMFSNWPVQTGETPPVGWQEWLSANGTLSRVAGLNGSPNSLRMASVGTPDWGIAIPSPYALGASPGGEYMVCEAEFTLVSGNLTGSGIYFSARSSSANMMARTKNFATDADATGVVRGAGVAGSTYRYRFLLDMRAASVDRYLIYGMVRYGSFAPVGAVTLDWHRLAIRAATPEEIAAGVALPALQASVTTTQEAVADFETQNALARFEVSANTGGGTARLRLVSSTYGTQVLLDANYIKFGDNTTFDNAVDVLVTTTGSVSRIIAWGAPFGTDGTLTEWEGPSNITWGNHSRTNANFYRANVAPFAGGGAFPSAYDVTSSHVSRVKTRSGAGSVTTDTVTLTPTNATGAVTYQWAKTYGDGSITITSPTGATTAFTGSVSAGEEKQAMFAWTATDAAGKVKTGTVGVALIGNV